MSLRAKTFISYSTSTLSREFLIFKEALLTVNGKCHDRSARARWIFQTILLYAVNLASLFPLLFFHWNTKKELFFSSTKYGMKNTASNENGLWRACQGLSFSADFTLSSSSLPKVHIYSWMETLCQGYTTENECVQGWKLKAEKTRDSGAKSIHYLLGDFFSRRAETSTVARVEDERNELFFTHRLVDRAPTRIFQPPQITWELFGAFLISSSLEALFDIFIFSLSSSSPSPFPFLLSFSSRFFTLFSCSFSHESNNIKNSILNNST